MVFNSKLFPNPQVWPFSPVPDCCSLACAVGLLNFEWLNLKTTYLHNSFIGFTPSLGLPRLVFFAQFAIEIIGFRKFQREGTGQFCEHPTRQASNVVAIGFIYLPRLARKDKY